MSEQSNATINFSKPEVTTGSNFCGKILNKYTGQRSSIRNLFEEALVFVPFGEHVAL